MKAEVDPVKGFTASTFAVYSPESLNVVFSGQQQLHVKFVATLNDTNSTTGAAWYVLALSPVQAIIYIFLAFDELEVSC